ncbi:MAG: hypothetical protein KC561_13910, partial [Myxococcales bacterium]|nr:hypothetical protein [Myxococcales bacterium]
MAYDDGDQAFMAVLIKQQGELTERANQLRNQAQTWVSRAKLALKHGNPALAAQAKAKAVEAKVDLDAVTRELESVRMRRSHLRFKSKMPDDVVSVMEAEVLVEQFKMQGINPDHYELEQLAKSGASEEHLDRLKQDLGLAPRPTARPTTAFEDAPDPLAGLDEEPEASLDSQPIDDDDLDEMAVLEELERLAAERRSSEPANSDPQNAA